ncbi:MAG: hypothetical protein ABFS35_03165 [Bacteroidota bacterium]
MIKTINKHEKIGLEYYLLKILKEKYANANEIKQKLKSKHINYMGKDFFPALSHLLLNNFLCYSWINRSGSPVKYYHLTRNGNSFLRSITIN